jgi:hypothetical protein
MVPKHGHRSPATQGLTESTTTVLDTKRAANYRGFFSSTPDQISSESIHFAK